MSTIKIIKYPKLYHKDSTGKIRVWWMEQDGHGYRTNSGINDGQIVTSNWSVVEGKCLGQANATTSTEQAKKEILAKYKKQKESGYFERIEDVDKTTFFEPMLAHKYLDYRHSMGWSKGAYVSPKLDGVRCIITKAGAFSRTGKPFVSFPHITRELKPLFDMECGLVLDGEIYTHRLNKDFNKIISLAKKTKPTAEDLVESEKFLQYWVFDMPSLGGEFADRWGKMISCVIKYTLRGFIGKHINLLPHILIHKESDVEMYLQQWLIEGYEGIMINTFDGLYEHKRSQNLLKYKLFIDEEFEISDITEGIGNRSGMFGRAILKNKSGKFFESNARGTEEFYKQLLRDKSKLKGKMATVRYQNLTPDGVPRFPVIVTIRDYE
jgi:ATP-dependent DNA ligase